MAKLGPTSRALGALAWSAFCLWWAFGRDLRVPLLTYVDLGFHELGHLVFYVVPISDLITASAGSAMQLAVPIGLACYFVLGRGDRLGGSVCLAWAATSAHDTSIYIADAVDERLPLIGGEHDWAYILGPQQLDRLDQAGHYARLTRGAGLVLALVAAGIAVDALLRARRDPDGARRVPIRILAEVGPGPAVPPSAPVEDSPAFDPRAALGRPPPRPDAPGTSRPDMVASPASRTAPTLPTASPRSDRRP